MVEREREDWWKDTFEYILKYKGLNLIEFENNAILLIFGCFFDKFQTTGYTRKINEFNPVFSLQKIEKGWFYKTSRTL